VFTPQQIKIIELFGEGQAVVAGAGCGKTTTLVAKCLELMKRSPEARFCAVSFTEKSVRDLKTSLAEGFAKENAIFDPRSHWVKTIHGLCATIIQDFPLQAGLQGGETVLQEDQANQLWERSVTLLWSQNESAEISESVDQLLQLYSRSTLETLLKKLRSLMSFGVDDFIHRSFDRAEVKNLWLVFESVYLRYQHAKKRQGHLDFNDLEIYAVEALKSEVVCRYYQNRFNLVLVDEFQDTNPLQGKILERFVKPDLSNLCIVGDPKQSIYRFRDADVSVFNDLIQKLPSKHLLDTNYRSRPGVIQFVNEVCAPVFEASDLSYEPLQAGRESDESISVSRLILENDDTLAQFLKSQQAAGVDLSEYVILMRSLRNARGQSHLKSLDRHQVPFILGSGGRFYSDPRVQELVALLKGFSSSKNTLSQVNALRAPWIQVPDATLIGWKDHYYEKFFGSSHPVAKALAPLFNSTVSIRPGQILETLMSVDSLDEEMSMPLVTLWHKAEALSSQARRFDEVVDYFTDAIDHEKIEKEVPPPVKSGTVRVMTIHGSKGLQFPRVILTDFEGPSKSSTRTGDLIWDRKKGVHLFLRDEEGKKTDDKVNDEWSELEKRAMVAEGKRVFYVAVTRPQEELILAWKKEVKTKEGIEPFAIDNWRAWIEATVLPPEKKWTPAANLSETLNAFSND
jgi:ATP-dependent helicase/nuclease subunit A